MTTQVDKLQKLQDAVAAAHVILAEHLQGTITADEAIKKLLLVLDNDEVTEATDQA